MIQWVIERASRADLISHVLVATDDERIFTVVKALGADVVMTPKEVPSGSDRVALAAKSVDADIVVNIQGDEPFIEPEEINQVVAILLEDREAVVGTLVKKITDVEELESPNTAKVVVNEKGNVLYFSRSPIPFFRDGKNHQDWIHRHTYYKHVGIYSYRKDFLLRFARWAPTPMERMEKLEQLRILEKGFPIKVAETDSQTVCVDTPEDLEKVRRLAETKYHPHSERC